MSDNSKIEWTEATWNPATGCTKVSPGCDVCYAETFAERWRGVPGHAYENGFDLTLRPERLDQPLRWKKPRRIFVNSMSDLFHDDVPDEFIARVWAIMHQTPRHTYQVLTKRHGRMRSLLSSPAFPELVQAAIDAMHEDPDDQLMREPWPPSNVWLGVSVENQQWADIRVPALLCTPAAVRWLSCEPLLGRVDLGRWLYEDDAVLESLVCPQHRLPHCQQGCAPLNWVVVGGESGTGARPMHPDWARLLRDQCVGAGVPFFLKQHGAWQPIGPLYEQYEDDGEADEARMEAVSLEIFGGATIAQLECTGHIAQGHQPTDPRTWLMARVGKKRAGRELDGRTWDEFPAGAR